MGNYYGRSCDRYNYCASNPCTAPKFCHNTNSTFECLCPNGLTGNDCSTCDPQFCLNGGTCATKTYGSRLVAFCTCPAGYRGRRCERSRSKYH